MSLILKLLLWFLNLVLNSLDVDPRYSTLSVDAFYITHEDLHLLGKIYSFRQLQGSVVCSLAFSFSIFWLCVLITDAMFAVQL